MMTTYNVLVGVVELVEADSEEDAIRKLSERVTGAGFSLFEDDDIPTMPHAFKSEPTPTPLCADDYARAHGYTPDMGDDGSTFAPGVCAKCGRAGIVFTVDTA